MTAQPRQLLLIAAGALGGIAASGAILSLVDQDYAWTLRWGVLALINAVSIWRLVR